MVKFILTLDQTILDEYPIVKARTTIGRRSVSDIHLDHLAVSGEHAAILQIGNDYYLEDMNSTNGTRINGRLVKKHLLQSNEVVEIGRYQLRFISDLLQAHAESISETPSHDLGVTNHRAEDILKTPRAQPEPHMIDALVAKVKVLNGSNSGRELTIDKALTTLGKVGSQVAVITKRPHGYFISHIEGQVFPSVNGTFIGSQSVALQSKDIIDLAGVKLEFSFSAVK